jgi:uncharacterized protein YjbI with pentapeptide repeats
MAGIDMRAIAKSLLVGLMVVLMGFMGAIAPAQAESFDRQNLRMSDFSGQDLRGNDFTRADLAEADLRGVNLQGVRMFDANLVKANLEGADLRGATLDGARFIRANLTNAILSGSYAFNADFRKATITGTDFTDVMLDLRTIDLLCEMAEGTNAVTGNNTRDTLYCP